jgi:hypothetical protein
MPAPRSLIKQRQRSSRRTSIKSTGEQLNQVLKAIESERDNLSRAQSLLGCLSLAMEYGEMNHKGPYYPDVVQMAARIVRKSLNALDPINLPSPCRDKVREEFLGADAALLLIAHAEPPLLPPRVVTPPRRSSLRIHRRDYSRASLRIGSSRDSASANISGCVAR